jgi:hypothetical protein
MENWQPGETDADLERILHLRGSGACPLMKIVAKANRKMLDKWKSLGPRYLPFADAATEDLPLGRLMRLSMFQWSIGMAAVLLTGTLNRVMIVELGVPTSLVALMMAIPVLAAPFRALIGHRSDTYKSALGVRRVPYIWLGTILQFGGLAIMPFALLLLQSQTTGPEWAGPAGALARLPAHRHRHAHGADRGSGAGHGPVGGGQPAAGGGADVCDAAGRHADRLDRVCLAAQRLFAADPDQGGSGRRRGHGCAQHHLPLEAGTAQSGGNPA